MFEQAKKLIEASKTIYIAGHVNPDGDAIGASFALALALKNMGKDACVIMQEYAETFEFLEELKTAKNIVENEKYDLLIGVDSSDSSRLAISSQDISKADKILMFDHHKLSSPYGDVNCIQESLPATCELIYEFFEYSNIKITQDIAKYLYLGILTDTGSFTYSCTTARTLQIVSKLLETGLDFSTICKRVNEDISEGKLKLIAKSIEKMEVYFEGKVRYTYIDYETIKSLGLDDEESEGMANYIRRPRGTKVALYVREKFDGSKKVSMRSTDNVDLSNLAISLGGGGHTRAAGFSIPKEEPMEEAKKKLLKLLEGMVK